MARADGLSGPVPGRGGAGGGSTGGAGGGSAGRPGGGTSGRPTGGPSGPGRPGPRRRAPYRLRLIFAGLLALLLIELVLLILVGRAIGPGPVLLILLGTALIGALLVRRESGRAWAALRTALNTGRMPGRELVDASLILVGGLLLLLPGFVSDLLGIFLILPFTRSVSRRLLAALMGAKLSVASAGAFGAGRQPDPGSSTMGGTSAAGGGAAGGGAGHPAGEDIIEGEIIDEDPPPGR